MNVESMRIACNDFVKTVKTCYGDTYLNRIPTEEDLQSLEEGFARRNFLGCIGSTDCMHLHWKNCSNHLKGQYHNPKSGKLATIQVESVCDYSLYCWHAHSRRPGTNNDLTVLESSPWMLSILDNTRAVKMANGYAVKSEQLHWHLFFLMDGIHPSWSIFVKPISNPANCKEQNMAAAHESKRKDVERLFGVLQGHFRILRQEFHEWRHENVAEILDVWLILHNMLVHLKISGNPNNEFDDNRIRSFAYEVVEEFEEELFHSAPTSTLSHTA